MSNSFISFLWSAQNTSELKVLNIVIDKPACQRNNIIYLKAFSLKEGKLI